MRGIGSELPSVSHLGVVRHLEWELQVRQRHSHINCERLLSLLGCPIGPGSWTCFCLCHSHAHDDIVTRRRLIHRGVDSTFHEDNDAGDHYQAETRRVGFSNRLSILAQVAEITAAGENLAVGG